VFAIMSLLYEQQINEILEREAVRLPIEELKATGPGPEAAFVITQGRRIKYGELGLERAVFEQQLTVAHRIRSVVELMGESFSFVCQRMGY
jgi:hypothetical protein